MEIKRGADGVTGHRRVRDGRVGERQQDVTRRC